jgi:nicotinamidase-related amidase
VSSHDCTGVGATGATALLLLDLMPVVVPAFGGDDELLARLGHAADVAREAGIHVIHARVAFRPGAPDVPRSNKVFSAVVESLDFDETSPSTAFHRAVSPMPGDSVVVKRRVSAFAGSDLDIVLRSRDIQTLVLAGVSTAGVVLSTLRQAADLDYRITVLSDGCADTDEEVHDVLMRSVFPVHADVLSTEAWLAGISP